MKRNALVLGGAGFIGSNIAEMLLSKDFKVTVIDGLLPLTGGDRSNISSFLKDIVFIESKIEDVRDLGAIIQESDVIIDAMAWTSHIAAIQKPEYDLELNCLSHLHLIKMLKGTKNKKVIYLGSRGQYGNPVVGAIVEDTVMVPEDIQGIHKLAAESYYRVFSKLYGFDIISLRIPNVFGKNQPYKNEDIGLVGLFIVKALTDEMIEVYDNNRRRSLLYVNDLAEVVVQLIDCEQNGFTTFNVKGYDVSINWLANEIIEIVNAGKLIIKGIPDEIKKIDIGSAVFDDSKLKKIMDINVTDIHTALLQTTSYFKEKRN
jgi:UDP-glucose 4-epimerase